MRSFFRIMKTKELDETDDGSVRPERQPSTDAKPEPAFNTAGQVTGARSTKH